MDINTKDPNLEMGNPEFPENVEKYWVFDKNPPQGDELLELID